VLHDRFDDRICQPWTWDLRAVNGKGLDLRLRLPDRIEGLEAAVRAEVAAAHHARQCQPVAEADPRRGRGAAACGEPALAAAALRRWRGGGRRRWRGRDAASGDSRPRCWAARRAGHRCRDGRYRPLRAALLADLPALLADFDAMRAAEGRRWPA
jgi:hypothetical protein